MSLPVNPPRLEEILATHSPIFIGTVVDSGGLGRMAKIKVEIPIRGENDRGVVRDVIQDLRRP